MFIIGEKINGMFGSVARAIREKDEKFIRKLAASQIAAGADALDVNVGPASDEPESAMKWLIETVQKEGNFRVSIDTPSPEIMESAVAVCKNRPILNSATASPEKLSRLATLARRTNAELIVLTMDEKGIPSSPEKKLELAAAIISLAGAAGLYPSDIYIDPILLPVAVSQSQPRSSLELISQIKLLTDPAPKTIVGLSNVSQGAAKSARSLINRTYLAMAVSWGLDAAICDPLDEDIIASAVAAELLADKFIYCESFVESFKKNRRS